MGEKNPSFVLFSAVSYYLWESSNITFTIVWMKFSIMCRAPNPSPQHVNTVFIVHMDFSPHKYPKANFFLMVQNFRWLITQKHFFLLTCKCKQDSKEKYTPTTPRPGEMYQCWSGLRLNVCRKELEAQNKKSKHICGNQETVAFLHTNQLISVWNKRIVPRKKKKRLGLSSPSHRYPNGFWDVFNWCLWRLWGKLGMSYLSCSTSGPKIHLHRLCGELLGKLWESITLLHQVYLWDLPKATLERPDPRLEAYGL